MDRSLPIERVPDGLPLHRRATEESPSACVSADVRDGSANLLRAPPADIQQHKDACPQVRHNYARTARWQAGGGRRAGGAQVHRNHVATCGQT